VPSIGGVWESSNPSVATIENDGTIIGISTGTVVFTFTSVATGCSSASTDPLTVQDGISIDYGNAEREFCI